jgi:predicted class III extradiol MEMO1 family dioxygenase
MELLLILGILYSLNKILKNNESFYGGAEKGFVSNILNSNCRAAIIPHAGEKYAGDCRKNAFINLNKNVKYIIYIAAIHNSYGLDKDCYLLKKDNDFPDLLNIPDLPHSEHSFDWVESELRRNFTQAKILAFSPLSLNINYIEKITNFMKENNDCILLSTTDLVHYGKKFKNINLLNYPEKLKKQMFEEEFLYQITKKNINLRKINKLVKQDNLMCGPFAINMFMNIIKNLSYNGKIVDYYDSSSSMEKDLLNKYTIKPESTEEFVSYVSVVYGKSLNKHYMTKFDIMIAIGMVKSKIYQDVFDQNSKYKLSFPKWSTFNKRKHGIFVGTELNNQTNCSYGRFEDGNSSSNKIMEAAGDCKKDASGRWLIPYSEDNLEKIKYKVELLDSKNIWERITGNQVLEKFKFDGKHGMKISFPDGAGATYLPVVAKDYLDEWSIKDYMNNLTSKAYGGIKENNLEKKWNNSEVKVDLYKSVSYTWDPQNQTIKIF